ncbi:MAG: TolC family protein [Polyangiaceae bacterium]
MTIGAITLGGALTSSVAAADTLSLTQALEMGMQKSPNVRAAKLRTESADAATSAARAGYLPRLEAKVFVQEVGAATDGSARATVNGPEFATRSVSYTSTVPGLSGTLIWNVWDFGKTSNSVAANERFRDAAAATEKETTLSIASSIASSYLNLFYQERLLDLANATMQSRDKLNAITKGLVKNGIQPPMEEIRAGSRLEAARRDFERAKAGAEDARTQLALALGLEPSADLRVTAPRLPRLSMDTATALREADDKRPQLAAAKATADGRQAAKDQQFAQLLPNLFASVNGTLNPDRPDYSDYVQTRKQFIAQVGLSGAFDFGSLARLDQASADAAAAEADLEATRRDTKSDATRATISVRATAAQLEHARKAEEGTQAVRAIVEARYIRGLSSPLELVDAEDSDIDARQTRIQTELDHALAIVRLCVAIGRPITEEAAQ